MKKIRKCRDCGVEIFTVKKQKCSNCNVSEDATLGEVYEKYKTSFKHWATGLVRARARLVFFQTGVNSCQKCGYDKHIEVCHIKPITSFDLDVKVSYINDIDNLIGLCPNCHWEMDHKEKIPNFCKCGREILKLSKMCLLCASSRPKRNWPSNEELSKLVWEIPSEQLAIKFGMSDAAISKYCKRNNIPKPPRGYWTKKKFNKD